MAGVSAEHGHGVGDLVEIIASKLPPSPPLAGGVENTRTKIAFIGRPNVGKSSLCNRLLDMERLIVSDVPGTTRETVELDLDYQTEGADEPWRFRLFDTAGLKRRNRIDTSLDYFSSVRTKHAIDEVDVVFLVLDAREVTKQDKILAGHALDSGRALSILVNKWDLALESFRKDPLPGYEDEKDFRKSYIKSIRKELFFLPDSPISFVSAQTGFAMQDFLQVARDLDVRMNKSISTSALNKLISEMWEHRPPAKVGGKRFKVFYAVQVENRPFRIKLFCNREEKLNDQYSATWKREFNKGLVFPGAPLSFLWQERSSLHRRERVRFISPFPRRSRLRAAFFESNFVVGSENFEIVRILRIMNKKCQIAFLGSDEIALPFLKLFEDLFPSCSLCAVLTQPDRPAQGEAPAKPD